MPGKAAVGLVNRKGVRGIGVFLGLGGKGKIGGKGREMVDPAPVAHTGSFSLACTFKETHRLPKDLLGGKYKCFLRPVTSCLTSCPVPPIPTPP